MKNNTINYDFYANPSKAVEHKGSEYHVRILGSKTVDMKDLAERISKFTTGSEADVMLVMTALRQVIVDELSQGNSVSIDGICKIRPSLGVKDGVCTGTEKGNSIQLQKLNAVAVKSLFEEVSAKLRPCSHKTTTHSEGTSEIETYGWLTEHFKTHAEVTCKEVQEGFGLTYYMANKHLSKFVAEGKLRCPLKGCKTLYVPVPGNFGISRLHSEG